MNKIERVSAVLQGTPPDRLPVSFWYHFGPDALWGPKAVEAHVRHVETYDLDFLKVMCDGRYPLPQCADGIIEDVADLDRLAPCGATRIFSAGTWRCFRLCRGALPVNCG